MLRAEASHCTTLFGCLARVSAMAAIATGLTIDYSHGAQPSPESTPSPEAERVIVVSINVPTPEEVFPEPEFGINRDFIEKSGERETAALLRDLPAANANGVPISNNAAGFTPG